MRCSQVPSRYHRRSEAGIGNTAIAGLAEQLTGPGIVFGHPPSVKITQTKVEAAAHVLAVAALLEQLDRHRIILGDPHSLGIIHPKIAAGSNIAA